MRKSNKMNGLFKAGFIILLLCIPMFLAALAVAYILEEVYFSAIFSAGGAFLAFVGIILVMFSKPKKFKPKKIRRNKKHLQRENEADENAELTALDKDGASENIDNETMINYN